MRVEQSGLTGFLLPFVSLDISHLGNRFGSFSYNRFPSSRDIF